MKADAVMTGKKQATEATKSSPKQTAGSAEYQEPNQRNGSAVEYVRIDGRPQTLREPVSLEGPHVAVREQHGTPFIHSIK